MEADRNKAWELLLEHNREDMHIKHALAVEAAMRHFAILAGEDPDRWGLVGLLHDLDWEEAPEEHAKKSLDWLKDAGYDEAFCRAVSSHAWEYTGTRPESPMEKTLYAVDELTGLLTGAALVRPSRSLADLEVRSVMKKWKDKAFARGVNREIIQRGAELLEKPLEWLIQETLEALRPIERELGLGA
jgi:predicted hydrolase (HD superfamily)